jgi:pimeloyl-ACP methyl ester carboxylesterase
MKDECVRRTFRVSGEPLAYDLWGPVDGPLVVALPGMGDLRSQYRHLAPRLTERGYRVAALDLRGHGESSAALRPFTPEAVGADALALIEHLGADRAALMGSSATAASAVWAAAEAPERVSGLVLLGPVTRDVGERPALLDRLFRFLFLPFWGAILWGLFYRTLYRGGAPSDHDAHVRAVVRALRDPARRRAMLEVGMSTKATCAARLDEVRAPALVVMGTADPDFPDPSAEARELGERLGTEPVLMAGVGHYPHLERVDETARAVVTFLEGSRARCRAA